MTVYEGMFLLDNDLVRAGWPKAKSTVSGLLEKHGGTVLTSRRWDERRLAYRIKKNRKAHYTLMNITAPHAAVAEMERQMGLSEDVLRFMTFRVDELDEEPSAMMQKRDRDDRRGGGRGDRGDRGDRGERSGGSRPPRRGEEE